MKVVGMKHIYSGDWWNEIGEKNYMSAKLVSRSSVPQDSLVIKSLIWEIKNLIPIIVLLPITSKVNKLQLANYLQVHISDINLAPQSRAASYAGCSMGVVPPFGHPTRMRTIADQSLLLDTHETEKFVYGGSGTSEKELHIKLVDLLRYSEAEIADIIEKKSFLDNSNNISVSMHNTDSSKAIQVVNSESFVSNRKSKSLLTLIESCEDVNSIITSGKTAIHLAAWRGTVTLVQSLLDRGADINVISTGEGNYGKTALFYAITRCRDDMVVFLLKMGARVKIVNNKGQTPRSLAVTHLSPDTIEMIERCEVEEDKKGILWDNHYESHADGRSYGDLDPRFIPDVKIYSNEQLVMNNKNEICCVLPTTVESRKRNFQEKFKLNETCTVQIPSKKSMKMSRQQHHQLQVNVENMEDMEEFKDDVSDVSTDEIDFSKRVVTVQGVIISKRHVGKNLVFIDLVPKSEIIKVIKNVKIKPCKSRSTSSSSGNNDPKLITKYVWKVRHTDILAVDSDDNLYDSSLQKNYIAPNDPNLVQVVHNHPSTRIPIVSCGDSWSNLNEPDTEPDPAVTAVVTANNIEEDGDSDRNGLTSNEANDFSDALTPPPLDRTLKHSLVPPPLSTPSATTASSSPSSLSSTTANRAVQLVVGLTPYSQPQDNTSVEFCKQFRIGQLIQARARVNANGLIGISNLNERQTIDLICEDATVIDNSFVSPAIVKQLFKTSLNPSSLLTDDASVTGIKVNSRDLKNSSPALFVVVDESSCPILRLEDLSVETEDDCCGDGYSAIHIGPSEGKREDGQGTNVILVDSADSLASFRDFVMSLFRSQETADFPEGSSDLLSLTRGQNNDGPISLPAAERVINPLVFVGLDCEWRPANVPTDNITSSEVDVTSGDCFVTGGERDGVDGGVVVTNPVCTLQLAFHSKIFVLDLLRLCRPYRPENTDQQVLSQDEQSLSSVLEPLFGHENVYIIGFHIKSDLQRLFDSYRHLSCFQMNWKQVIDLNRVNNIAFPLVETKTAITRDKYSRLLQINSDGSESTDVHSSSSTNSDIMESCSTDSRNLSCHLQYTPHSSNTTTAVTSDGHPSMHVEPSSTDLSQITQESSSDTTSRSSRASSSSHTHISRQSFLHKVNRKLNFSVNKLCVFWLGYRLDKQLQCSDWSRRPLSTQQMAYAGLDAAVLLLLFNQMATRILNSVESDTLRPVSPMEELKPMQTRNSQPSVELLQNIRYRELLVVSSDSLMKIK